MIRDCDTIGSAGRPAWKDRLPLASVTSFSLQDFPNRSCCILWFTGCQMRCPYCHNPELAKGRGDRIDVDRVLNFLRSRRRFLDGVTLSGGECLLSESIVPLAREIKAMGYLLKVDTNGAVPERLLQLLAEDLVDYVAMDFKAPLDRYEEKVGWSKTDRWLRSFQLLVDYQVDFELRTTVHPDLLGESELLDMFAFLREQDFRGSLFLQHYQNAPKTLGDVPSPSRRLDLSRLELERQPFEVGLRNFTRNERRGIAVG